ncbi:blastula protease 10-like [Argiope bruennichi]|uniref:blastula protease 10-like n=1 Tax=Argiope bruennichi TaxID=94029 RepID=UPI0024943715|nr:blastula protease 10-like [Argiope bruennichi]
MMKSSLGEVTAVFCLIQIIICVLAEDDLAEFDEKLILTQLGRTKTDRGQLLFEGDIIDDSSKKQDSMKALPNKGSLWLDRIIPYEFHSSVNKSTGNTIRSAMDEWEKKTCLKFVPRTNQKQFLRFRTDAGGCFTFVGKKNMEGQDVNLGPGCEHLQITMHEIGHSLGFYHEHSRRDRSEVIKILWHNIEKGMASQFRPGNDNAKGVPYDVTSVMHYSPMSFSSHIFEKNTMVSLDPRLQTLIGRSRGITFRDAKLANMMYSCDDECPNKGSLLCQNYGYLSPYQGNSEPCTCVCPPNTQGKKCEKITGDYYGSLTCGGDIHREGIIQSPGYPSRKPNDSCTWKIQAPSGKKVRVIFEDFSFRPRMDKPSNRYNGYCVYEHVEIRTSNMDEGDFYCGEDISEGTEMVSSSNTFLILIRADSKGQGRGLKANIKFI